jgi:hypothetical protein
MADFAWDGMPESGVQDGIYASSITLDVENACDLVLCIICPLD